MRIKTYLLLSLRYNNPFFRRHLRPYPFTVASYLIPNVRTGVHYLAAVIVLFFVMTWFVFTFQKLLLFDISPRLKHLLYDLYVFVPTIFGAYFYAKKFTPRGPKTNQFDRKITDLQLLVTILTIGSFLAYEYL